MGIKSFFNRIIGKKDGAQTPGNEAGADSSELDGTNAFARTYSVELYFAERPATLQGETIHQGLKYLLGNVGRGGDAHDLQASMLHFYLQDHLIQFGEGNLPAQICVFNSDKLLPGPVIEDPNYAMAFEQIWDFPDAVEKLAGCHHTVLVTDMMSSGLDYRDRIDVFQRALYVVVKALKPVALFWHHSQRWMDAELYMTNDPESPQYNPLMGPMHLRLFNIADAATDEIVFDTLGLSALGLHDLQIHCKGRNPDPLSGVLLGTGHYLFEHGDVIADGNTLTGLDPDERWVCRHELSLIEPRRMVIDINLGAPYAAGNRS